MQWSILFLFKYRIRNGFYLLKAEINTEEN